MTKNRRAKQEARRAAQEQNLAYVEALRRSSSAGQSNFSEPEDEDKILKLASEHRAVYMAKLNSGLAVEATKRLSHENDVAEAVGIIGAVWRALVDRSLEVRNATIKAEADEGLWTMAAVQGKMVANPIILSFQGFDPRFSSDSDSRLVREIGLRAAEQIQSIERHGRTVGVRIVAYGCESSTLPAIDEFGDFVGLRQRPMIDPVS